MEPTVRGSGTRPRDERGAALDRFRSRLRQVHLSSLRNEHHVPLTESDEDLFGEVLDRCRDVPWILEALPPASWARALKANPLVSAGSPVPHYTA